MPTVKDFDQKSDTEKWLFSCAASRVPGEIWESGSSPDFKMSIGGHDVDVNEFFKYVADAMDRYIEQYATDKAVEWSTRLFSLLLRRRAMTRD